MPFIYISTSTEIENNNKKKILEEIPSLLASLTNKSEKYVMAKLEDNLAMYFENDSPCCYLEIKSIGSLNPSDMAPILCDYIQENIGIPKNRIYICFEDVPSSMWGWNGKTFG